MGMFLELHAQSPKQEVRAVWLTSNYALDWPDKPFRNIDELYEQQANLIHILDKLKAANFNMVFLQTRLRGDVIYRSAIEPVSPYIQEGKITGLTYDALTFAVAECHKRGLECHAWFVTYPLRNVQTLKQHLDKTKSYGEEFYMDPGDPGTNTYLLSLIEEIVEQYDIDGIHLDYIRYPDNAKDFPDQATYQRFGKGLTKSEWRQENINRFVYQVYDMVKSRKRWVQVSSSVMGIYDYIAGTKRQYATAAAVCQNPEKWLRDGKHDFIVPMMYCSGDLFRSFVRNWQARSHGRWIIPGLGIYRIDEKEGNWKVETIEEQIQYTRDNRMEGNAMYRTRYLMNNQKGILDILTHHFYRYPAVLPPLTWLSQTKPEPPQNVEAITSGDYMFLYWDPVTPGAAGKILYNVYRSESWPIDTGRSDCLIAVGAPDGRLFVPLNSAKESGFYYAVTSSDRYHNESRISDPVYYVMGPFEK
ncbi:MAG: family 10 glycosylhydrolase [Dysgonamonadaceae bacterium]|nr:family 10 glycosylhydrolase [Dysgonamonadaceae bacterium]